MGDNHQNLKIYILNNKGMSLLPLLIVFSVVIILGQQYIVMDQNNNFKNLLETQIIENQKTLLSNLTQLIEDEVALRNSRLSSNSDLYSCLFADPSPCDERKSYDMILYAPNPPMTYAGGKWISPPTGFQKIAGGLEKNKMFYTRTGAPCLGNSSKLDNACPIQAIIQFKPLCGGTANSPQQQSTPGSCSGRPTGIDIIIGMGILKNGTLKFKNEVSNYGDTKVYRLKANSLMN